MDENIKIQIMKKILELLQLHHERQFILTQYKWQKEKLIILKIQNEHDQRKVVSEIEKHVDVDNYINERGGYYLLDNLNEFIDRVMVIKYGRFHSPVELFLNAIS